MGHFAGKGSCIVRLDYFYYASHQSVVFQNIRGCGNAVCLCLGYGVLRGWTDGAGRNGRYFGCFSCRFGTEPFCSSCFSVDESVGVCR